MNARDGTACWLRQVLELPGHATILGQVEESTLRDLRWVDGSPTALRGQKGQARELAEWQGSRSQVTRGTVSAHHAELDPCCATVDGLIQCTRRRHACQRSQSPGPAMLLIKKRDILHRRRHVEGRPVRSTIDCAHNGHVGMRVHG